MADKGKSGGSPTNSSGSSKGGSGKAPSGRSSSGGKSSSSGGHSQSRSAPGTTHLSNRGPITKVTSEQAPPPRPKKGD